MSDYAEQIPDVGVVRRGFENLMVKPARFGQSSFAMVIQRLAEEMGLMFGQGLSIVGPLSARAKELMSFISSTCLE